MKSFDFHSSSLSFKDENLKGVSGPIPYYLEGGLGELFLEAGMELGYPTVDINTRFVEGL